MQAAKTFFHRALAFTEPALGCSASGFNDALAWETGRPQQLLQTDTRVATNRCSSQDAGELREYMLHHKTRATSTARLRLGRTLPQSIQSKIFSTKPDLQQSIAMPSQVLAEYTYNP